MAGDAPIGKPTPGDYPCPSGKRQYEAKADARGHRSKVNHHNSRTGQKPTRAYRCDRCGFWHVGRR